MDCKTFISFLFLKLLRTSKIAMVEAVLPIDSRKVVYLKAPIEKSSIRGLQITAKKGELKSNILKFRLSLV